MDIVTVLKRKDASALVVGVVVAIIVGNLISSVVVYISSWLSGLGYSKYGIAFPGTGWKGEYLYPVVTAVVSLLALEVLIRLYVAVHNAVSK